MTSSVLLVAEHGFAAFSLALSRSRQLSEVFPIGQQRKSPTGKRKRSKLVDVTRLQATEDRRPEVLRRLLVVLVTALIVARPLVLGEDPGLLNRLSNAWSLLVSLLWFVAAAGWAAWRAWSGQTRWRGSAVEAGLLAVAVLAWVSAGAAAHYKHPAMLIASEWLVLLCAYCLVRQLARTPDDSRCLLAALLASAVSISAFAIYQYAVVFPEIRRTYGTNREALLDAMAAENVVANPELLQRRLFEDNVFATYSHPNCLAGFLALLLPVVIVWTLQAKGKRQKEKGNALSFFLLPFSFYLAAASTLLVGLALWLTHSRGAILASLFVGVAVLAACGRRFLVAHKAAFLTGVAVVAVLAAFIYRTELAASGIAKFWQSSAKRNDYWIATWSMICDHPWLGVGPGNFGRLYPRYMLPRAFEQIKDPHNFLLEMWATGGVFVLIALLITLGMFFRRVWPVFCSPWSTWESGSGRGWERESARITERSHSAALPLSHSFTLPRSHTESEPRARWEFYVGGMVGLVLGFVLRVIDHSTDEIVLEGAYSACRSIIWFATFALLSSIPWSGASLPVALTAGVTAFLLNLLVSGGIAMPSVAQPLWVMMALTVNFLGLAPSNTSRSMNFLPRILPLPVLAGIGLAYFLLLFYPAVSCGSALSQARRHYTFWHSVVLPRWRGIMEIDKRYIAGMFASCTVGPLHPLPMLIQRPEELAQLPQLRLTETVRASWYLQSFILNSLERAVDADPGNAMAWLELAEWYGELGKVVPEPEPIIDKAIHCAEQVQLLDPDNKDPYLFKHALYVLTAQRFGQREKEQYGYAAAALRAAVARDPTNARLLYQLAETLFLADLPVDGRRHAKIAQELDEQATRPERELTASQREQIRTWLTGKH